MNILELEKKYCRTIRRQCSQLHKNYVAANEYASISLQKSDVTKAILMRMKTYYETQDKIKNLLDKRFVAAGADYFVETVCFYLKLYLQQRAKRLEVHSERQIIPARGMIRPDISIWHKDHVIAIIECKTNLGWNRKNWEKDFKNREKVLQKHFPKAKALLLVLTSRNWSGFAENDPRVKKQFFSLSSERMREIKDTADDALDSIIEHRIEKLFGQIVV